MDDVMVMMKLVDLLRAAAAPFPRPVVQSLPKGQCSCRASCTDTIGREGDRSRHKKKCYTC